jgi:hypothetical protein
LLGLVGQMTLEQIEHHGLGGGDWSVKELLGHVESWEEHVLGALDAWSRQQQAPIHDALNNAGLDAVNAGEISRKALRSYDEQLASTLRTREQLRSAIESMSDAAWLSPPLPGVDRSVSELIGSLLAGPSEPFTHDEAHLPDLRAVLA